ncbi:MAG: hypothetical protein ACRD0J_14095, partial [Acidimicrobiales bacterium]
MALAVLVVVPVAAFAVPSLLGHIPINGDNPVQAYPLRALAGAIIQQGHLPLWDPYLWSGSPLLAGFNAGALFPATGLFAIMSPPAAWVVTEILVYVVAALGFYALCRALGRSVGASFLASISFSFAGFMTSQLGHIDLVEGVALAPWMLLGLHQLSRTGGRTGRWVLLFGASFALTILAGDPEAVLDMAALAGVYTLTLIARHPGRRLRILGLAVLGMAGALAVGAVQWLPGLALTAHSQRATVSYAFFGAGSLPRHLLVLFIAPFLLGGYGSLGHPAYFGPYNLSELNAGIGILPVMAFFALLVGPRRRAWWRRRALRLRVRWRRGEGHGLLGWWRARSRRHRILRAFRRGRSRGDGDRGDPAQARGTWAWYVVIAVGVVLALGSNTTAGHLLFHIPYYGHQRTQSRNLLDADVGLAVLLA